MATAKKAPAKKPAKLSAKKPVTKKSAKKSATTKTTVSSKKLAKAEVTTTRTPLSPLERLRGINISMAISALLFSILTLLFVGPASAELLLNSQARDSFANLDSVALGSASEVLTSVEYRYLLVTSLLIGAVGSLLLATKLRKAYEVGVKAGISGYRWIFIGLSSAILLEYVSFIGGVQDVATLKLVAAMVLTTAILSWLSDRENAGIKQPKWLAFGLSLFVGAVAWIPLVASLVGTTVFGDERFGWHVYALAGVTLAGFIGIALTQYSSIKKKNQLEYVVFEQRYLRIDQLTKFLVVLITVAALQK